MSPFNHAKPALFPTLCSLISVLGFSKQMQIDLMICISRSLLSLISSDILVKDFFCGRLVLFCRVKILIMVALLCSCKAREMYNLFKSSVSYYLLSKIMQWKKLSRKRHLRNNCELLIRLNIQYWFRYHVSSCSHFPSEFWNSGGWLFQQWYSTRPRDGAAAALPCLVPHQLGRLKVAAGHCCKSQTSGCFWKPRASGSSFCCQYLRVQSHS